LLNYPLGALLGYFTVAVLGLVVFLSFFEMVTKYNCWEEIRKGNVSVAMATGGKIFGICNVLRFSIEAGATIYETMKWAVAGFLLLLIAYFMFEFLTPVFSIDEEIAADNRAVGLTAMLISVSLSYVIGAAIF
jgi:putative membrane protein